MAARARSRFPEESRQPQPLGWRISAPRWPFLHRQQQFFGDPGDAGRPLRLADRRCDGRVDGDRPGLALLRPDFIRSEEHTSELQSLMRISYAVFCLKKKKKTNTT